MQRQLTGGLGWREVLALLLIVAATLFGAVKLVARDRGASTIPTARSPMTSHAPTRTLPRTVLVFDRAREPAPSEPGMILRTRLVGGHAPKRDMPGTVLSDSQCEPDSHRISHCLNRIKLSDGTRITLRHPHKMKIPCLEPGEQVNVRSI